MREKEQRQGKAKCWDGKSKAPIVTAENNLVFSDATVAWSPYSSGSRAFNTVTHAVVVPTLKLLYCYFTTMVLLSPWIMCRRSDTQSLKEVTTTHVTTKNKCLLRKELHMLCLVSSQTLWQDVALYIKHFGFLSDATESVCIYSTTFWEIPQEAIRWRHLLPVCHCGVSCSPECSMKIKRRQFEEVCAAVFCSL